MKQAIVFDLDNTLMAGANESGIKDENGLYPIVSRVNLEKMLEEITKLKGLNPDLDVLIWTTATSKWAKKFIETMPEKYREMFDFDKNVIHRENQLRPKPGSAEEVIYLTQRSNKAITILDYDRIILVENNNMEYILLQNLFEGKYLTEEEKKICTANPNLQKDIRFIKVPNFDENDANAVVLSMKPEHEEEHNQIIELLGKDPTLLLVAEEVKKIVSSEKKSGLHEVNLKVRDEYKKYLNEKDSDDNFSLLSKYERSRGR